MRRRPGILLVALWGLALAAASEAAQEHEQEESPSVLTVRTSVKATGLVSRAPDAPDLFSERTTAQSMVRFRIEPEIAMRSIERMRRTPTTRRPDNWQTGDRLGAGA